MIRDFDGACCFFGCYAVAPHSHCVCETCGALNYRGDCRKCRQYERLLAAFWTKVLREHGLLDPKRNPVRRMS